MLKLKHFQISTKEKKESKKEINKTYFQCDDRSLVLRNYDMKPWQVAIGPFYVEKALKILGGQV
jgi:hypothetical protein